MAIRTTHRCDDHTWFITFTCFNWMPLFEIVPGYDLLYHWLKMIKEKYRIETFAFVIMPNHAHLLLYIPDQRKDLNKIVGNGKRFMAYEIVKRLRLKNERLLDMLSFACSENEKNKGQKHKIFEPSFDAKPIFTTRFLYQKLDYIHANPVKGKWGLCSEYTDYAHSSAKFYADGIPHPSIAILDYREHWH